MIREYLMRVDQVVSQCPDSTIIEEYTVDEISETRANLRIRLRMDNHALLSITEAILAVNDSLTFLAYTYHLQDAADQMVFRYDDSGHYRHLPTHPHHKHLPGAVLPSVKPTIEQAFQEAIDALRE